MTGNARSFALGSLTFVTPRSARITRDNSPSHVLSRVRCARFGRVLLSPQGKQEMRHRVLRSLCDYVVMELVEVKTMRQQIARKIATIASVTCLSVHG